MTKGEIFAAGVVLGTLTGASVAAVAVNKDFAVLIPTMLFWLLAALVYWEGSE